MELKELQAHIRTLVSLDEAEAPVLSCYLHVKTGNTDFPQALGERVGVLRKTLPRSERASFEEALARVDAFLESGVLPTTRGLALFARGGSESFFLPLQFQVTLPNRLSVDRTPHIYHLVELKDTYDRYIVMICTREVERILEVNLGAVTKELWAARPELGRRVGSGWTRKHYQRHSRAHASSIKQKIQILERLGQDRGHTYLILAGDPRITARVRRCLPDHLAARLIDIVPASGQAETADIVAATLSCFIEHEEQESTDAVALLLSELWRNGLGVVGTTPTLLALERGQVDVLLMAAAYEPPTGWVCSSCGALLVRPARPSACDKCDADDLRAMDLKEQMVKLAEQCGSEVEFVRHSDVLMELGGVGCLLRYQLGAA